MGYDSEGLRDRHGFWSLTDCDNSASYWVIRRVSLTVFLSSRLHTWARGGRVRDQLGSGSDCLGGFGDYMRIGYRDSGEASQYSSFGKGDGHS